MSKKEITNPAKPMKAGFGFYSPDALFYLSDDNKIVVEEISFKEE